MIERGEREASEAILFALGVCWAKRRGLTSVLISRKHWDSLLLEIEDARRQRHLLTYRALIERLQLPTPAMTTLTAALEHLASLDARSGRPLRSSLVISQGASRLPRTGFFGAWSASGVFRSAGRPGRGWLACGGSGPCLRIRVSR